MQHMLTPADYHPDLTAERLRRIVSIICEVRRLSYAKPDAGKERPKEPPPWGEDGPWGIACTVYERIMLALALEARREPWLTFKAHQYLAYFLMIGEVPIRIGRADRDLMKIMGLESVALETMREQGVLKYDDGRDRIGDHCVRLEFDVDGTDATGFRLRVRGAGNKALLREWTIDGTTTLAVIGSPPDVMEPAPFSVEDVRDEESASG